ncbi:MAG: diguanylate cyclase/phosphodiesterase with sensor(s) [Acidimicrobiales bacterium]|nr:diguanylate cyclase/phosphodiesterase with sensor(s) [Acidimicrobiales bacterium]
MTAALRPSWLGRDSDGLEHLPQFQTELLAAVGQAIIVLDLDHTIIYWNRAAEDLYGWTAAEAVGRCSTDLIRRAPSADSTAQIDAALWSGKSWVGEYEVVRRDGASVPLLITNTPMRDPDGNMVAIIGSCVDLTERNKGEAARRQLAAIVESSADAIFSLDTEGIITTWNGGAQALFGYAPEEIIGQSVTVLAPPDAPHEMNQVRDAMLAGSVHERLEVVRRRSDGTLVDILITASTMANDDGRVVGVSVIAQDIGRRLAAQRALQTSESRLADAQRRARIGSFEFDVAARELSWSAEYQRILGIDDDLVPTAQQVMSMVHVDDADSVVTSWRAAIERGESFDIEARILRADGEERWVRMRSVPEVAPDGSVVKVPGTMMDDTERVEADRVRRAAERRSEVVFERSDIGAAIVGLDGRVNRVNSAMCRILCRPESELLGRRWGEYLHPDDVHLAQAMQEQVRNHHNSFADERRYIDPDGAIIWVSANVTLVRDETGTAEYFAAQFQDITHRKALEVELERRALYDSLTGLPNRTLLSDRLAHSLRGTRRCGADLAVLFLDIDQFKVVNDSFGHGTGDALLQTAATRISDAIRPGDTVARFGGDEFVVVCENVSIGETELIAARILDQLAQPWCVDGQELRIRASVGIVIADEHSTPESLVRDSDAAMYRAKERGRGCIELFDETLRVRSERRMSMAAALHRALEHQELSLVYQPVVDLRTGEMLSAEALLRWNHPERGPIMPAEFIPLAEETGLIVPIGAWVLDQACHQLAAWHCMESRAGRARQLSIAVNLSIRQLADSDVVDLVEGVLGRTGVRAEHLCLELTESLFMEDVEFFDCTLGRLKAIGVGLAIDDFGTGYSSLSYLKRFPVDAVKVDRAFVDGLGSDPHDTALVAAIVAMAGALELTVTAEGVETFEQLHGLRELGVPRAQGFHLARPMSGDALSRLVAEAHVWDVASPVAVS